MGHRVNNITVTKRTFGFKISSDLKDIPEVTETNKPETDIPEAKRPEEVTVKLEAEAALSRLAVFPSYDVLFRDAQSAIFADNGPLPVSTRHYIAMMGARAAGCPSLASLEESLFLSHGGDPGWLSNFSSRPAKLARLEEINKLLCKTPRLLTSAHIKSLTDGDESFSITEAVRALVVLIHNHALATFIGAATQPHIASTGLHKMTERKSIEFLDIFDKSVDRKIWKHVAKELKRKRSFSEGEITKTPSAKTVQQTVPGYKRPGKPLKSTNTEKCRNKPKEGEIRVQDFGWDEHGYSVLARFYQELAVILDDKFRNVKYSVSQSENSNSKLSTAVWYYVQSIFGVHYDDYNYQEMDQVLDQNSKDAIQLWCNQASGVSPGQQQNVFSFLANTDKLEVAIVLMEARFLSEMLFATQSVMKYMS